MPPTIAHIAVGLPVEGPFDYRIPEKFEKRIAVGDRVAVNFAHAKRLGIVVGLANESEFKDLKEVEAVLDAGPLLTPAALQTAALMARQYGCSQGEALDSMLPQQARKPKAVICRPADKNLTPRTPPQKVLIHSQSVINHWPKITDGIRKTLQAGRGVIILVPETFQIPFVMRQLNGALPSNTIIHDNTRTPKIELENWAALREGKVRAVIGLRTAVFSPLPSLGLILMCDEDNASYQEEQTPFYHARDIALMRSETEGCDVVFMSPSPSVELMHLVFEGKIKTKTVASEFNVQRQLIDMTNFASKGPMTISFPLRNSLEQTFAEGGKSLIMINRRGFNTFTRCLFCGHILKCDRCSSNLAYSSAKRKFECRSCGTSKPPMKNCPKCGKDYLKSQGKGVERIVTELRRLFPAARVEGIDKESAALPRKFDILVSTQVVFRFLGDLSFDTVAALELDAQFNRAHYRAAQQAYSLLSHLALLSTNRLQIQTFHVDNSVLRDFVAGRADEFYRQELQLRAELKLPPYSPMVKITLRGVEEKVVCEHTDVVYNLLGQNTPDGIECVSMQPDAIAKLRDQYRYMILVRGQAHEPLLTFVKGALLRAKKKSGVTVTVQVDS